MNYIELINRLWQSHEAEQLSTTEIALYFYLVKIFNSCHWADSIKRLNVKINADLNITYPTMCKARNRLKQVGLIDFKTQNGNSNTTYTLKKFLKVTNEVTSEVGSEVSDEVSDEINKTKTKLNKTKDKERENEAIAIVPPLPNLDNSDPPMEQEEIIPPLPPAPLTESETNFIKFQKWIISNAPQVARFKEPFTKAQFEKLKKDFPLSKIQDMLTRMHNRADLTKKNINANRTFRNWVNIELKNSNYAGSTGNSKGTTRANIPTTTEGYTSTLPTTIDD